jgi:hypothetical protein
MASLTGFAPSMTLPLMEAKIDCGTTNAQSNTAINRVLFIFPAPFFVRGYPLPEMHSFKPGAFCGASAD